MNNSNIIQEFNKFMNAFLSEKNAINKKIVKSLDLTDDQSDDIIEIDDDNKNMKFSKRNNDANMIENKNEYDEKKKNEKKKKKKKNSEIIVISDQQQ